MFVVESIVMTTVRGEQIRTEIYPHQLVLTHHLSVSLFKVFSLKLLDKKYLSSASLQRSDQFFEKSHSDVVLVGSTEQWQCDAYERVLRVDS